MSIGLAIVGFFCEIVVIFSIVVIFLFLFLILKTGRIKQYPPFLLIFSFSLVDLGIFLQLGILTFPFAISQNFCFFCFSENFSKIYQFFNLIFSSAFLIHLAAIAVDRFVAVIFAPFYKKDITRKKIAVVLCFLWFFPIFFYVFAQFRFYSFDLEILNCANMQMIPLTPNKTSQNFADDTFVAIAYYGSYAVFVLVVVCDCKNSKICNPGLSSNPG